MGSYKNSIITEILKDIAKSVYSQVNNEGSIFKSIVETVKNDRFDIDDEDEYPEDYDYDGGYYDAEHNKYPEREEGIILINGKPYKPPNNKFGF